MPRDTKPTSSHTFALLTSSIPNFQIRTRRGAGGRHNVSWSCTEMGKFSSRPTRRITHHQRCGQVVEGLQSQQTKSKETMHLCSPQQDRLHVSQGGPVAAPPKHSPMMRERHLVTPLKRNSCSASRSPFASSACPRTVRGHSVAHVDVHRVTCTAVLRAQTQVEPVQVGNGLALHT